jgi:hypothetical protein
MDGQRHDGAQSLNASNAATSTNLRHFWHDGMKQRCRGTFEQLAEYLKTA